MAIRKLCVGLGELLSYSYAIVFLLTIYEVVMRYAFRAPTQWTLEVALIVAALHYFFSGPQSIAADLHIRISFLADRLPAPARRAADAFGRLIGLVAMSAVLYWAAIQAWTAIERDERAGTILNSPLPVILKLALAVALLLMILLLAASFLPRRASDDT
ncbi:TRAP transporter small permease subunit [Falsiroseomonas sp. HW251]|uniref:TRAP transporter small permease subunit n=1 Tax=Falsiroseomonas sp. HW251 TaxID=3390998 RepID=UPI003D323B11